MRPVARSQTIATRSPDAAIQRPGPPSKTSLVPRRKAVSVACNCCRKRKERCDGKRPSCSTCITRAKACSYPHSDRDLVRTAPLKRSLEALQGENEQWRELYLLIKNLPDAKARQALVQIRTAADPIEVLDFARHLANSGPSAGPSFAHYNPRVDSLDLKALSESRIRVHARPWTIVAGDGIVSELITSFFAWDHAFLCPFIDPYSFLEDMRTDDPEKAKYCSPFLVNAICATRCFTSSRAKSISSIDGRDIGSKFVDEAKKMLDRENGRASLPTVQGLALLFLLAGQTGSDRAGMMYRYASYEMLFRLHLDKAFNSIKDDPAKSRQRQIISRALWGLFCFESVVSYMYIDSSLLVPPTIPRCFETNPQPLSTQPGNVDMFGAPYTKGSTPPPFVPRTLNAQCDLSLFLYRAMQRNAEADIGSEEDLRERRSLYKEVLEWRKYLPAYMKYESNPTPQTCYLRVYFDEVLTGILRPLPPDIIFDNDFNVRDLCIKYADIDTRIITEHIRAFPMQDYSCMTLSGLFNAVLAIVPHLDDPKSHAIFFKATLILRWSVRDFPMSRFTLLGIKALAWTLKIGVPPESAPHFENLMTGKEDLKDIPLAIALPPVEAVRKFLSVEDGECGGPGIEMGLLLSKWSTLSIE
ncbi:putative C6 transcription factor [Ilyonectria sp. MPI-CAGE-AT-0026]|nr:putative C6 transcription factor [Ilyonectria sp. MPI-CAGE-AT-0026]